MSAFSDHAANGLAGACAGLTVDAVLYPLDTIKTRLQARGPTPPLKMGTFYRGMLSHMLGSAPAACTFWLVYEGTKEKYTEATGGKFLPAVHVAAAVSADICVTAVRNPFEVVKQQMQVGMHKSFSSGVQTILRKQGVAGLYTGYVSTVMREAPFDAVQFLMYERFKSTWESRQGGKPLVLWQNGVAGFFAGGIAAAVTTPLDVVKTRLITQVQDGGKLHYSGGVISTLRTIAAEEGVRALFSGIVPRVAWISIGGSIFIGSFEELRRRIKAV